MPRKPTRPPSHCELGDTSDDETTGQRIAREFDNRLAKGTPHKPKGVLLEQDLAFLARLIDNSITPNPVGGIYRNCIEGTLRFWDGERWSNLLPTTDEKKP